MNMWLDAKVLTISLLVVLKNIVIEIVQLK